MGFTVSLVLVSSVFLMSLGYPYTTDFQDQPNRINQTVSLDCIRLYTHCIRPTPSQLTGLYGLYGLYTPFSIQIRLRLKTFSGCNQNHVYNPYSPYSPMTRARRISQHNTFALNTLR